MTDREVYIKNLIETKKKSYREDLINKYDHLFEGIFEKFIKEVELNLYKSIYEIPIEMKENDKLYDSQLKILEQHIKEKYFMEFSDYKITIYYNHFDDKKFYLSGLTPIMMVLVNVEQSPF